MKQKSSFSRKLNFVDAVLGILTIPPYLAATVVGHNGLGCCARRVFTRVSSEKIDKQVKNNIFGNLLNMKISIFHLT